LAIENGFETAAEITVLQQEIIKQEKVHQQLVEQGQRYQSLLETMERFTEKYVRACEDLRTSTKLAKQSKLNSAKSTEFIRNLQIDCEMWEKNKNLSMAVLQGSNPIQDPGSAIPLWGEESSGARAESGPGTGTRTGTGVVGKESTGPSGNAHDDESVVDTLGYRECSIRIRGRDSLVFALNAVMTQDGVEHIEQGVEAERGQTGIARGMSRLGLSGGDELRGRVTETGQGRELKERQRETEEGRDADMSFSRSVDRSTGRSRERNRERNTNRDSRRDQSSDGFYDYFIKDSDTVRDHDRTDITNRTTVTNITNVLTGTNIIPDETFLGEKIFLSDAVDNVCTHARTAEEKRKKMSLEIGQTGAVISRLRDVFKRIENSSENLMLKTSKNTGNSPFTKRSNSGRNKPNLESGNIDSLIAAMKEVSEIKETHRIELTSLFKRIDQKNAPK
jgi:hypothetical protein